jgi:hypothetical protein
MLVEYYERVLPPALLGLRSAHCWCVSVLRSSSSTPVVCAATLERLPLRLLSVPIPLTHASCSSRKCARSPANATAGLYAI